MSIEQSWLDLARAYRPRRAAGLPPGQREVAAFPRFSDEPLRWAPPLTEPKLSIAIEGEEVATIDPTWFAATDQIERTHDFHCVTTWSYRQVRWAGHPLIGALEQAGIAIADLPIFAKAQAADERHAVFLTEDLLDDSVMLATHREGSPLGQRHGGPLRLITPKLYGYKNAKHLIELDFTASQPASSFGTKEHLRARVALEERHATRPNWMLRVPYRLTVVPTALAAEHGLRKSPK